MFNYIENRDVNGLQKRFKEILDEYEGEDKLAHAVAIKNVEGKTLAHIAIEKGYIEFINLLGEVDAPLNEKDNQNRTPLHIAVEKGSLELVQELLTWDVSLNEVDSQGKTALQLAEEKNNEGEYGKIAALLRTRQAWQEAAAGFRFNRVVHLIKQVFPAVEPAKNKDKVLFIGRTGAGKSTLLNYLNGTRYEIKVDPESAKLSAILVEGSKKEIFDVGNGMGSHTLYPQVIEKENANYVYCDLAGLFDSHGDEERICAASSVQILSRLPGQIKGIIVLLDVPGLQPAGRGEAFKRTAVALAQMIQENPALMSSVHFIITHIPKEVQNTMTSRGILNKYVIPILKSLKKTANSNKRLDTEEQALQFMLQQMVKLGERSILISNITDEGENREQIERTIENLQAHDADLYSFVSHDDAQESFNFVLTTIAQEFLERRNQIENILPKKIAEEEEKQEKINKRIGSLRKQIKHKRSLISYVNFDKQIAEKEQMIKQNLNNMIFFKAKQQTHQCDDCRMYTDNKLNELEQSNQKLRKSILKLTAKKSQVFFNNARLNDEIEKVEELIINERSAQKISSLNLSTVVHEMKNIRQELEVNQDLFKIVYEITHILELGNNKNIFNFWRSYETQFSIHFVNGLAYKLPLAQNNISFFQNSHTKHVNVRARSHEDIEEESSLNQNKRNLSFHHRFLN